MPQRWVSPSPHSDTVSNLKSVHERVEGRSGGQSAVFGNHHTAVVLPSGRHPAPGALRASPSRNYEETRMEETTDEYWVWISNFSARKRCRIFRGCSRVGGGRNGGQFCCPRYRKAAAQDGDSPACRGDWENHQLRHQLRRYCDPHL